MITADTFPSADRIYTFAEGQPLTPEQEDELAARRKFAEWQADETNRQVARLQDLPTPPDAVEWARTHQLILEWRYNLGVGWSNQKVIETRHNLLTPISDDNPNIDRFGDLGRFRIGSVWDKHTKTFVKGDLSRAGRALIAASERIHTRMDEAGVDEELQNVVQLPDGTKVNGNKLFRGETARRIWKDLRKRLERRGIDVSKFEMGDDIVLAQTAARADRIRIFQAVVKELARLSLQPEMWTPHTSINRSYLLFQAVKNKRGSAASIPTFNATGDAYLTGNPVTLPPNADLYAATTAQDDYIDHVRDYNT